jgi:hypothetical protein
MLKTILQNNERILKSIREKNQITYKGELIKIMPDFSTKTLKARAWSKIFQALKGNKFNLMVLYTAKQSFITDEGIKIFHDKQKLKQYITTKSSVLMILEGILHTEDKN